MSPDAPAGRAHLLREAIDEVRVCFRELRFVSDALGAQWGVTAAMRATLEHLHDHGGATVPELARAKRHRSQSVQEMVNALAKRELVSLHDNPAHRRSAIVRLSDRGREVFAAIRAAEDEILIRAANTLDPGDLAELAPGLRALQAAVARVAHVQNEEV